jgi:hypothetical protein
MLSPRLIEWIVSRRQPSRREEGRTLGAATIDRRGDRRNCMRAAKRAASNQLTLGGVLDTVDTEEHTRDQQCVRSGEQVRHYDSLAMRRLTALRLCGAAARRRCYRTSNPLPSYVSAKCTCRDLELRCTCSGRFDENVEKRAFAHRPSVLAISRERSVAL